MHDIYLNTTQIIYTRHNLDFFSFHVAFTNFDRGFQECVTTNENSSALFSSKKISHSLKKRCSKILI